MEKIEVKMITRPIEYYEQVDAVKLQQLYDKAKLFEKGAGKLTLFAFFERGKILKVLKDRASSKAEFVSLAMVHLSVANSTAYADLQCFEVLGAFPSLFDTSCSKNQLRSWCGMLKNQHQLLKKQENDKDGKVIGGQNRCHIPTSTLGTLFIKQTCCFYQRTEGTNMP